MDDVVAAALAFAAARMYHEKFPDDSNALATYEHRADRLEEEIDRNYESRRTVG